MRELHDIVESLLDRDGSFRDLNFEAPTWSGVRDLLDALGNSFEEVSGTSEDLTVGSPMPDAALTAAKDRGWAHLRFEGGGKLVKDLQVFVGSEEDGSPFVELTFSPEDVEPTPELREEFIAWAQQMREQLGARRYYARYGNASWQFGDTGPQSGVFLVGE